MHVCAMYLHARTFCTLSDMILYSLWAPIFFMITEGWPRANRAMVTNNLTLIIEVVLIDVVLIEGFLYSKMSMHLKQGLSFCNLPYCEIQEAPKQYYFYY